MARILKPLVRGGGWYPSKKWIPLVKNGGYTTQNGGDNVNWAKVSGVSPLSLPNALAHFINSLRQIGKCTVSGTDITCNNGVLKYDSELGIYADGTPEEIKVVGKNLLDPVAVFGSETNRYTINSDGSITVKESDGRQWSAMPEIPIKAGTYTYSRDALNGWCDIRLSTENYATPHYMNATEASVTFTMTEDGYYKTKCGYSASSYPFTVKLQIELGSTATDFAPFHQETATASNLFAVGSVKDEQDIISGTITRRCEAVVSDGTTPSGRYIGTVGEGNILVCAKETGYSGAIASFTADKAEPLSGLVAEINPVQDLHGQSSPWPAGGGKNKINAPNVSVPVNLDNYTVIVQSIILSAGTYTLSWTLDKTVSATRNRPYYVPAGQSSPIVYGEPDSKTAGRHSWTFTLEEEKNLEFRWWYHTVSEACTISDFQLEVGSTATAWTPYSNLCPISGHTGVSVEVTGVNQWDEEWELGSIDGSGNNETANDRIRSKNYIAVKPNTTYYVTAPYGVWFWGYDANKVFSARVPSSSSINNQTLTVPSGIYYLRFVVRSNYGTTYNHDISINYPSTDTSYHAYTGEAISVTFPTTVYGGSDDVISGQGTSTMGMVDFSDLSWSLASATYGRWYAVIDGIKPPADGATPLNAIAEEYKIVTSNAYNNVVGTMYCVPNGTTINVCNGSATDKPTGKLCYELATPATFTHEGQSVDTLYGQNNVFVDTGNVTTYIPDFTTEKVAGQSLSTTEGTNTLFVTSNVDPVEIEVEYAVAPDEE